MNYDNLDVPEKSCLVIPSGTVVLIIQEADRWFRAFIVNLSSKTVVFSTTVVVFSTQIYSWHSLIILMVIHVFLSLIVMTCNWRFFS